MGDHDTLVRSFHSNLTDGQLSSIEKSNFKRVQEEKEKETKNICL